MDHLRVVKIMTAGTHTIFLGEVTDCELNRADGIPMTYLYYHTVIKGNSPKNAPTYVPPEEGEQITEKIKNYLTFQKSVVYCLSIDIDSSFAPSCR